MAIQRDDSWMNVDKTEHQEEKEKELVQVRCHKDTREEESLEELAGEKAWEIPRRWHIY